MGGFKFEMRFQFTKKSIFVVLIALIPAFLLINSGKKVNLFAEPPVSTAKQQTEVFQKIKIKDIKGKTLIINNPEIDYSDYKNADVDSEDYDSFGIRIKNGDEIEPIIWDDISRIDIIPSKGNSLSADVKLINGNKLKVDLLSDSKGGLSGITDSGISKIRLREIKSIEVFNDR